MKVPKNKQYILFGGTFVLANKLQAVADKSVQGLSTKQWFLLRNLSDMDSYDPPTITMLSKMTDTSRQNITKMLLTLQRHGYVALQESTDDHRSLSVLLTDQGSEILRKVALDSTPFLTELFSDINEDELEAAATVVVKLINKLNKMQEKFE